MNVGRRRLEQIHAAHDRRDALLGVVEHAIANHPRSLQVAAGPSELGHPCKARLAYKFAGAPEVNPNRRTPWKPTVGTAVHTWLDETFSAANQGRDDYDATGGRYWCEVRVNVGEILGQAIEGNCDLFVGNPASTVPGKVVDFKIVGDDQLRKYKREQLASCACDLQGFPPCSSRRRNSVTIIG